MPGSVPAIESLMQKTEPYAGVDNLEIMREAHNYNRFLLDTVRQHVRREGRTIDFGAGNGEFATPLTMAGFDLSAVEPDSALQRRLRGNGVHVVAGPHELPDSSFDYVYSLNVLEHIQDDVAALRDLHVKLIPRGTLLLYVPAFPILYASMDAKVGHVRRYTRRTLVACVTAAGFRVERIRYVDSIGFFAALLFKFVGRNEGNINPTALRLYDRLIFPLSRVFDLFTHRWLGKNLLLLASKQE